MPRTAEQQQQLLHEVTQMFEHTSISQLIPPPPTAEITKDEVFELLTMSDAVARAVLGSPQAAPSVKTVCEELISWNQKNRVMVQSRRSTPFTPSTAPNFVNHFVGDRNRVHLLIDLVSSPYDVVSGAFVEKVYTKMLASASASWQVDAIVFVGHREWQTSSFYARMRIVAAAYAYVGRIQQEFGRRRSLGLPTSSSISGNFASLSKYAPQARNVGAEAAGGGRASRVEVFRRWGEM
ncbi:hypothetical protein BCR35DRAFT_350603 [Leucosporidium creatinivorum]|uniref:Uncharacterized protein n=1 Tax=Leucosporidium creatinivorum TaxID=106004 RepID=A0A1Y2FYJ6_9BASI|nr:hypothetical protein BCR35DRAFT_350603 [Leucosporidium creatinivorum]